LKTHLKNIDLKIQSLIVTLNCLEHNWLEVLIPAMNQIDDEESVILNSLAEYEFNASYSEELANNDPNYDAQRDVDKEFYFYAVQNSLQRANQQTINALYISLGAFIDQCLIEIINDAGQSNFKFKNLEDTEKIMSNLQIEFKVASYEKIKEIRDFVNYLKHGKGGSAENVKLIIKQFSHIIQPAPLLHLELSIDFLKESIDNLKLFLTQLKAINPYSLLN
jgi:hypothetical protein